ncbi:MAG: hypothetical protein A2663_02480 [Candidatus Buchananbacteria bacterium RIFCSPHIGHO2_01_FULL_46_12]|uniref:Uncharacterized protein n=1 Tax=Candidatus Buchananbacteria bacterium RIFCSPHIGHO2_01_FULL_46_12 TaxID=1797536 RepID=A0A1G1YB85_9BACT|nr:MAG: hypothetical protein A2663_02480 [Candidatus Buchananbacteria bacterium RIFCSPHIGHO2_01_FULL_46_12]
MEIKRKLAKLSPFFQSAAVIAISALFVVSIVYAATTIGSSITTGGNLTVTGWASSTSATTTSYLYIGADGTEPNPWNFQGGDLYVQDDVFMGSQATSVASLWVGSAGTADNLNLTGGDLYVQDGLEVDGNLYLTGTSALTGLLTFTTATGTSATTTNYLMVGSKFTLPASWDYLEDFSVSGDAVIANKATSTVALWVGSAGTADNLNLAGGDLYVQDDLEVDSDLIVGNKATSTVALWVGSAGTADNLNLTGGDLYVQDGLEVDGNSYFSGNATTTGRLAGLGGINNFTTTTATSTLGLFVFGNTGTGTSTLGVGSATQKGCIELTGGDALYYRIIVDAGVLNVVLGRCN